MSVNRRDFVSILLASAASPSLAVAGQETQGSASADAAPAGAAAQRMPIVLSGDAAPLEKLAAGELAKYLGQRFPACEFPMTVGITPTGSSIRLGTLESSPQLSKHVAKTDLARPDSFVVTTAREGEAPVGIIVGADPRGTLFAVYALLEKLGYGFYLSYDTRPEPRQGPFTFDAWQLADEPLFGERIVFNWHNFLSGCTGWSLPDWQAWIDQAAKMRFTSVMVHAYGNNPMVSFTHNGQTKPTGFLATSARGRDWGNEHVNDVRRIVGGEKLFQGPVFGSSAGIVPIDRTVEAVRDMMKQVFAHAKSRGLGVDFALDVDTDTANPQNVIATLPEEARIAVGKYIVANPDTREGEAYYQSQVRQLLDAYPDIDRIVIWFRERGSATSPWCNLGPYGYPEAWQVEFLEWLQKHPFLGWNHQQASLFFVFNKLVKVWRRCLDKIGKRQVQLAIGNWEFWFPRTADRFLDPAVAMMCIQQPGAMGDEEIQETLRAVGAHRKVMVLPYAHDDDQGYILRSQTPPARFASWLQQSGCAGYGILHWTNRPLDIYFKSLSSQVWKQTRDQPLPETCQQLAERTFGTAAKAAGAKYLLRWITEAPLFARETGDRFMDRRSLPLTDPAEIIAGCRQRLKMLDEMPPELSPQGAQWAAYFRDGEQFTIEFFESHYAWMRSVKAAKAGEVAQARAELARSKPEAVIELYGRMASHLGATAGDKGLLISMNLRWLPYIVSQRQALGVDAIRWKFGPTEDEPLAMGQGKYTFFIDCDHHLWRTWGEKETGQPCFAKSETPEELGDAWLEAQREFSLSLRCITGEPLLKGKYNVKLLFLPWAPPAPQVIVEIELRGSKDAPLDKHVLGLGLPDDNSGLVAATFALEIDQGFLQLGVNPGAGKVRLCGVVLEPAAR
jgi:hypothetical protein